MSRLLPLLFLALPFAEIAGFVIVGRAVGLWATLALVILSVTIGLMIVKSQGLAHLARLRSSLQSGRIQAARPVVAEMLHSLFLAVAGILFIIPGFVTDILAILLLVPPVRALLGLWMLKNMTIVSAGGPARRAAADDIIEGEFSETGRDDASESDSGPGRSLPGQHDPDQRR